MAFGGAAGALLRGAVVSGATLAGAAGAVLGVLAANLIGAAALGWLLGRSRTDARVARWTAFLGSGVLGAFTTFSTLADQVARAAASGEVAVAVLLAVGSVSGGVVAAAAGLHLGSRDGDPAGDGRVDRTLQDPAPQDPAPEGSP